MADAFVADRATGLVVKLVSLAAEEVIQAWNLQENLVTLQERLEEIDALLSDADSKKLRMSAVQSWFNNLEDVARVADAFMDQLAYEVTRRKVENRSTLRHFFSTKNSILYRLKVAHKIKSIHTSFNKIFKRARDLGLQPVVQLTTTVQPREISNTPPCEDQSLIVGRDDDISFLVQTVCTNYAEDLPVIAVMGLGGQGKTTLARMVYNKDVVTDTFKKRMWVTVSDDFDFMKILNQMVVSLTSTASVLENTEGLINKLQSSLRGVKFLLVLDDVWNDRPEEWDNLRNSLLGVGGASGSKILVTTRKQKAVDVMQCVITHRVEKLSEQDSWKLFKRRAFSQGGVLETAKFVAMGRRMVERCSGLPLAIKTLGGLLRSKKSEQEWVQIQNSPRWNLDGVLSSLRLSYDNLPHSSLKKCFAYCSILPKDSRIMKDEMVRIWMALGFLLPPKGSNKLMEDIGSEYFNILLWNCLLQDGERYGGHIISYKMHDLVHDLALDISKHHSVTVKADDHELNDISKAIYVRVDEGVSNIKPPILQRNFEKVQVLYAEACIVRDLVPYPSHLIGLVLEESYGDAELPSSLSNLKYLKYLDISRCDSMYKLPDYIARLYNLQTLSVQSATQLPRKICNLINLRHILVARNYSVFKRSDMFSGIERLSCLQTLPHFVVSRDHQCFIGQLGSLKNLQGTLSLYGLGDVENMEEASKASLHTKSNIKHLKLVWRKNEDVMEEKEYNDEDVMEGLKPHTNLKELTVENFMGKKFATWITFMTNLKVITLENCKRCEEFPQLGHLPKLRVIDIYGMDNIKVISSHLCGSQGSISGENRAEETVATLYPSLRRLDLWHLPKLEEWLDPAMDASDEEPNNVLVFPQLEKLSIWRCSKLRRLPSSCYPLLKTLSIKYLGSSKLLESMSKQACGLTDLKLYNISGGVGCSSSSSSSSMNCIMAELLINNSVSFKNLSVRNLEGLTYLTLGAGLRGLSACDLPELNTINVVNGSDALKHLIISRCPNYVVFAKSVIQEGKWGGMVQNPTHQTNTWA
ncbi:hypothetical protein DCAR_0309986 [Daucus carota subsp. sativus]|uniref:Uncharacterized protein n=1 Tax=Daucus carota subsp. sativus TaxID=79200 RepID=A0A162AET3_DAUCS|nr:PREDICTED: putative disease resistance protein RGA4 [Daucus carota subsp. sativus]WOG90742.1 hypothetical protein DCAR_0309986 [Daucus carota subsp. sativus]